MHLRFQLHEYSRWIVAQHLRLPCQLAHLLRSRLRFPFCDWTSAPLSFLQKRLACFHLVAELEGQVEVCALSCDSHIQLPEGYLIGYLPSPDVFVTVVRV